VYAKVFRPAETAVVGERLLVKIEKCPEAVLCTDPVKAVGERGSSRRRDPRSPIVVVSSPYLDPNTEGSSSLRGGGVTSKAT
jgi:hypothetical protein